MSEMTYSGSCQCGAIAFEVAADLDHTMTCNCSRCRRLGSVLTFVPTSAFRLTRDGPTTEYRFADRVISHRFCPTCGIQPYSTGELNGTAMVAVNVNCLDGVDRGALHPVAHDGASA